MEATEKTLLAQGQGGSDASLEDRQAPNIFQRIEEMGNQTATSDNGVSQLAASLQTISQSMAAMKRDLDCLREGQSNDQSDDGIVKRSRVSPSTISSGDGDELLHQFLDDATSEAPNGDIPEWEDIGNYFEEDEETGEAISDELATLANKIVRAKPKEDKMKTMASKHKRPQNVDNLQVPKVDEQLWRQLRKDTKAYDFAMQKAQSSMCQAMVPVLKTLQAMKGQNISSDVKELTGDTLKILAQAIVNSNEARMEKIKRDLLPSYKSLCANKPSANKLFGDQLQENIRNLKDSKTNLTTGFQPKKPFLGRRGGSHNNQTYNMPRNAQGPTTYSPRISKQTYSNSNNFRNQPAKRGKPFRK